MKRTGVWLIFLLGFFTRALAQEPGIPGDSYTQRAIKEYDNTSYALAYAHFMSDTALHYPVGQYYLGMMYYYGRGVDTDYHASLLWFGRAAAQGYARGQNMLGKQYQLGLGVDKDEEKAIELFGKAAAQNYHYAQFNLGWMYSHSKFGIRNDSLSGHWYLEAAKNGNRDAENNLGVAYQKGVGFPKSDSLAVYWYRQAAEHGNPYGQANLGEMYERGRGVPQSTDEAMKWYKASADQDNELGKKNLDALKETLKGRDPLLYLKPAYKAGLGAKDKKDLQKKAIACFEPAGQFSLDLTLEDLSPLSSRSKKQPASLQRLAEMQATFSIAPDAGNALVIGNMCQELNMNKEAKLYFWKADSMATEGLLLHPSDSSLLGTLLFANFLQHEYTNSLAACNAFLALYPGEETAAAFKLMNYLALGEGDKLTAYGDSLLAVYPKGISYCIYIEMMNMLAGGTERADSTAVYLDKSIDQLYDLHRSAGIAQKYPDDFKVQFMYEGIRTLAYMVKLSKAGGFSKADKADIKRIRAFYEKALERSDLPSKYTFYKLLGCLSVMEQDLKGAIPWIRKAADAKAQEPASLFSPKGPVYDDLSALYMEKGRLGEAEKVQEEKISVLSDGYVDASDYVSLATYQLKNKEIDKAEESCRKALSINPAAKDAELGLATMALVKGEIRQAATEFSQIPESDADGARYYTVRGLIQFLSGEYKYAYNCFTKACELDKDFETPKKFLEKYFVAQ